VTAGRPVTTEVRYHRPHHLLAERLLHLAQPWMCLLAVLAAGVMLRMAFPGGWTVLAVTGAGTVVTAIMSRHVRHERHLPARLLPPVCAAAGTGLMVAVTAAGVSRPLLTAWAVGGGLACVLWDWRMTAGRHGDPLAAHFATSAEVLPGMAGTTLEQVERGPRKITSVIRHVPGISQKQLAERAANLESAAGYAPGSLTLAPHPRHADATIGVFTPPQALFTPIPWPGPSAAGESVEVPQRHGRWQDSEDGAYRVNGHHLLIQGMTGAGKTSSALWNEAAETVSRCDAAMFAADVSANAAQFLLPLAPALHGCATTPDEAWKLLEGMGRVNLARAAHMAARGQTRWRKDSGLTHLTLALEEFADLVKMIRGIKGMGDMESMVRTFRARGIRLLLSAQRFDYSQVPTFIRGQMAGTACFGVENRKDAEFGLSALQQERGARPEMWQDTRPGMCYLDAPTIPDVRRAMPFRYYTWGDDAGAISAYMAQWPAASRPLDKVTQQALNDIPPVSPTSALPVPQDTPPGGAVNGNGTKPARAATIPRPPAVSFRDRPGTEQAWQAALDQVEKWASEGRGCFRIADWNDLRAGLGRSRGWLHHTAFARMEKMGIIEKHMEGAQCRWDIIPPQDRKDDADA